MLQICVILLGLQLSTAYDNIALNKPAWQLNQYIPGNDMFDASNAVDGRKSDLSAWGGQCVVSADGHRTATWGVDLQDVFSIRHITIYHRTDNVAWDPRNNLTGRFLGFSLYVSNTTDRTQEDLCFHDTNYTRATIPAVLNVTCPVHGQYVIYYNERLQEVTYPSGYDPYAFNELCEVEVYDCHFCTHGGCGRSAEDAYSSMAPDPAFAFIGGCPVSYYGADCSTPCDKKCWYCHVETGACQGCSAGYQGEQCEPCSHQYYGELCKEICGNCSGGVTCNNVDGTCPNGCGVGVHGVYCKTPCPAGLHGKNCSLTCTNCDTCDRFTGQCTSPCYRGWKGHHCTDECDGRKYGPGCADDCGACLDYEQCHHINGSCLHGCDAGFEGKFCKTDCSVGFYGINCQGRCNANCGVPKRCDKTTGQCDGGCQTGWKGKLCDTKCGDNLYGPGCNQTCGKCKEDKQCHHVNGSCYGGCKSGYRGDKCDTVCEFGHFGASCREECSAFCQKSRDCHHVTGHCTSGCKTGWHGNDCLEVESQEQGLDIRFYGVLGALCLLVVLNGIYIVCRISKWKRAKTDGSTKYFERDSTTGNKDTGTKFEEEEDVKSRYQEMGDLSPSSIYDSIH